MSAVYDYDNPITAPAVRDRSVNWSRLWADRRNAVAVPSDEGSTVTFIGVGESSPAQPLILDHPEHFWPMRDPDVYGVHNLLSANNILVVAPWQNTALGMVVNASPYAPDMKVANLFEFIKTSSALSAQTAALADYFTIASMGKVTATTASLKAFEIVDPIERPTVGVSSPLSDAILARRRVAQIDMDSVQVADAATSDALAVVQRANLGGDPNVMFSSDGILTLQWQRGEHGVALIFAGDGVACVAFRRPGQFYAENGIDVEISEDLPARFNTDLAAILA